MQLIPRQSRLEQIQSVASIASSIAIPVVLAVAGYFVQRQIADDGIKKDYVSMATNILREKQVELDPALRTWAVEVITLYSPIKFTPDAARGLERLNLPPLPEAARQRPLPDWCQPSCSEALKKQMDEDAKLLEEALKQIK
ncbi:hypothetical protein [Pseudomonas sp. SDO5561_S422]